MTCVVAPCRSLSKKPEFSETFPEAVIREGADELELRADENTEHIAFERWGPPLVDADWDAAKQSTKE